MTFDVSACGGIFVMTRRMGDFEDENSAGELRSARDNTSPVVI